MPSGHGSNGGRTWAAAGRGDASASSIIQDGLGGVAQDAQGGGSQTSESVEVICPTQAQLAMRGVAAFGLLSHSGVVGSPSHSCAQGGGWQHAHGWGGHGAQGVAQL